jgi:hypothetical protein
MTTTEVKSPGWKLRLAAFLAQPRVRVALLAALVIVYSLWIGYQWLRNSLWDFNIYYVAAWGMRHGVDIYSLGYDYQGVNWPRWVEVASAAGVEIFAAPYLYPPLTAQLVVPLLGFSVRVAGIIWLVFTAIAFLISAWLLGKSWKQPEGPSLVYLLMLGFVPPLTTLHAGQVNGFLLLALVVAFVAFTQRKMVTTGVALAVAASLKVLPVTLCLYLGWRKQWLAAAAAAVALIAITLTAPLMLGPDALGDYVRSFSATTRGGILYPLPANQALSGFLARTLLPVLAYETVYQIYLGSIVVVVAATIAFCWPLAALPTYWRYEFGLIICAFLLIPPFNWYHMLVPLLIPLSLVVEYLWRNEHWKLLALLALIYIATDIHGLFYHRFEQYTWLMSFPAGLVVLCWALLVWILVAERKERRAAPASAGSSIAGSGDRSGLSVGR